MGEEGLLNRRLGGERPAGPEEVPAAAASATAAPGSAGTAVAAAQPAKRAASLRQAIGRFAEVLGRFLPHGYLAKQEVLLIQANLYLKPTEFVLLKIAGAIFFLFLGLVFRWHLLLTLGGALLGFLMPTFFARRQQARRLNKFTLQLENALNLIVSTLRAGFSFQQAIKIIAAEMPPPISEEFGRVNRELNLGLSLDDSLRNLTRFISSSDLDLMVTCVIIQSETGGNLAEILEKVSRTIRERIKLSNDVKALTAQGKLSGWVVGLLPFGLMGIIYLINPVYIRFLFEQPLGRVMLGVAVTMELIGAFFISRIVKIDV